MADLQVKDQTEDRNDYQPRKLPNYQKLADSLYSIAREIDLIPNWLKGVFDRFQHERIALRGEFRDQCDSLRMELRDEVNRRFESLELSLKADTRNQTARLYNSHVRDFKASLHSLYDPTNEEYQGFPQNLDVLQNLSGNKAPYGKILAYY
ncbi:MAG: hypothetical protein Q9190_001733 [Brigantiaea leucoxantha]